jgi:hypothetical protein
MKVVSTERDEAYRNRDQAKVPSDDDQNFSGYKTFYRLCDINRKPEMNRYLVDLLRFYEVVDKRERYG